MSYGGWKEIVQADTNNDISKDLFSMDNLDKLKFSASEIVESRQQNSSEYKNLDTYQVDVKQNQLENPYAQAEYTENDFLDEDLPVVNEMVEQNNMISGQITKQKLGDAQEPDLQRLENIFLKRKSDEGPQFKDTESYLDGGNSQQKWEQYLPRSSESNILSEMENEVKEETAIINNMNE